jgi:hypothetical protein
LGRVRQTRSSNGSRGTPSSRIRRCTNRLGFHGVDPNGEIDRTTLDEMQDSFVTIGSYERKLDLSTTIDTTCVERAVQRVGRLA